MTNATTTFINKIDQGKNGVQDLILTLLSMIQSI